MSECGQLARVEKLTGVEQSGRGEVDRMAASGFTIACTVEVRGYLIGAGARLGGMVAFKWTTGTSTHVTCSRIGYLAAPPGSADRHLVRVHMRMRAGGLLAGFAV